MFTRWRFPLRAQTAAPDVRRERLPDAGSRLPKLWEEEFAPRKRQVTDSVAILICVQTSGGERRRDTATSMNRFSLDPIWPNIDETEYKPFPIARQGLCGVEAFQRILGTGIDPARVESIDAVVPRMHAAMLSQPAVLENRTSLLCNLGFQFACAALAPELLYDPDRKGATPALVEFSRRVTITPSDEFDARYRRWPLAGAGVGTFGRGDVYGRVFRAADAARLGPRLRGDDKLQEKWRRILHGQGPQGFFRECRKPANRLSCYAVGVG